MPRAVTVHPQLAKLKVALVHDFLTVAGGAERVLDVFHALWPTAPIYTLVADRAIMENRYAPAPIRTSFIQRLPGGLIHYKWYLALMPTAIESFDLSGYDLVISDASAFAKGVRVPPETPHLCYLHTPTRYLWSDQTSYLASASVPAVARPALSWLIPQLQTWDLKAAARPSAIIANSSVVAARLERYYHRSPVAIVFPPVDISQFSIQPTVDSYWLTVARLEPYKRLDLILEAFAKLGWPIKVVGTGSRRTELAAWARYPNIQILGRVSDRELGALYGHARAVVFAANEDAGIVPLEAMAAGRPVLAYGAGGALESVVAGETGEFFRAQTVASLVDALTRFRPERYDPAVIRHHAEQFDVAVFSDKIQAVILDLLGRSSRRGTGGSDRV